MENKILFNFLFKLCIYKIKIEKWLKLNEAQHFFNKLCLPSFS